MAKDRNGLELKKGAIVTLDALVILVDGDNRIVVEFSDGITKSYISRGCTLKPAPVTQNEPPPHKLDGTGKVLSNALD